MGDAAATRRALVTGATGFVGSHLSSRLAREGWEVHLLLRPGSRTEALGETASRAVVHRHDGTTEGMIRIVAEAAPDLVFHLASLFLARHAAGDVASLVSSNVLLGTQLLEAMAASGARRLVNAGTSWQHFEDRDYDPVCLYAATKQAFEAIVAFYVETTPLRAVTLKLFDTYGPGDRRGKLFSVLRKAAEGGSPMAMSPGEQRIDLVYIDDAVEAFLVAGERLLRGRVSGHEAYAVSSGRPVRLRDVVDLYGRVTGRRIPVDWGGRPYRPREVMVPWSKGVPLPGWRPVVTLEEGIRRTETG